MKKIYALLMSVILLLGLTACSAPADSTDTGAASQSTSQIQQEDTGEGTSEDIGAEIPDKIEAEISDPAQSDAAPSDPALRHVLVLYFSATGNTKSVAEKMYTVVNSRAYGDEAIHQGLHKWQVAAIAIDVVVALVRAALEVVVIKGYKKRK